MNNIFKIAFNFVVVPLSGSILYITFSDLYNVHVSKLRKFPRPLTYKRLFNPGLVICGVAGYLGYKYGTPLFYTLPKILK